MDIGVPPLTFRFADSVLRDVYFLIPKTMKTRTAQDIRRDMADASRRLRQLKNSRDSAMRYFDVILIGGAEYAMQLLQNLIYFYALELAETTQFGEQLTFGF